MAEPDLYSLTPVDGDPHKSANTVGGAIDTAAAKYGLNPNVLKGIASIESSWDPGSNKNRPTQYKGLFQIGKEEWKQYGSGDIYNAQDNADAAAKMLRDHSDWFKNSYGNEPTPGDLYMMHQQGRGFIKNGTMTNVEGNPYPGMKGAQTPESFKQGWSDELARRTARYGDGGSVSNGTQTAAIASAPRSPAASGASSPSQPSPPLSQDDQFLFNLLKKSAMQQPKSMPLPTMGGPMTFVGTNNGNPSNA